MTMTRGQQRRADGQASLVGHASPTVLALIFECRPSAAQAVTASRVSRAWRAWAKPRARALWKRMGGVRDLAAYRLPLWFLQEAWASAAPYRRVAALGRATWHGDVDALAWGLPRLGAAAAAPWSVCEAAARGGALPALRWLRDEGMLTHALTGVAQAVAGGGLLPVLQWARAEEPHSPWEDSLGRARAQAPPCPWDGTLCSQAAAVGRLHVLQWLRAQDPPCPWSTYVCEAAGKHGHLHVLQWLRQQDPPCPWDKDVCAYAASKGHLATLEWARAQDPPCPWERAECEEMARANARADITAWLQHQPE
ncbi:MAG: hypothetical protein J3K34DRAFT_479966 [Monoraphidium minutum]|nr:MAG: hypothetical protein J3K34DRAFT_479966 [Monoraphidium minutum]